MSLPKEKILLSADSILNRLLIIFFFGLLMIYASREIADLDLWLHLKMGEYIVTHRIVPNHDIFSFSLALKPWINHEWLFQVISYLFYSHGTADGLILMQNIVLLATFMLLYLLGIKQRNHIFVFLVLYITLLSTAYRFTIRPDIFSIFFMTLFLLVIKLFIQKRSNLLGLLFFCQIIWVNTHGFAFTGPLIVLIFLVGEIIKRTVRLPYSWNKTELLDDQQLRQLLIIFVALIAAFLINPSGLKGAAYPLSVIGQISGKGKVVFQYIQELAKPILLKNIFDSSRFFAFKAFILISLFSFRFNQKHLNISDLFLWLTFLAFSLVAIRNVAYFSILAAYVIFKNVELALAHGKEIPFKIHSKKIKRAAAYFVIASLFYFPFRASQKYIEGNAYNFDTYQLKSILWDIAENRYPKKAVDFLIKNNFPKHMFNDFNSGAYLIGRTYPERQVFIDGRTEFYGPEFFMDYVAAGDGKKDILENIIKKYNLSGFFLTISPNDLHMGLLKYLTSNPLWRCVYFDDRTIIFLKDTRDNMALIKMFSIDLKEWIPPEPDFLKLGIAFRYPTPYVSRGRLLCMLGFNKSAAKEARIALEIQPNNAEALKVMAYDCIAQKKYKDAYKFIRNGLIYSGADLHLRTRLALVYHDLNDDEKALKVINAIIKKTPKYSEAYYNKALILKEKDKLAAENLLRLAIRFQNTEPKYHELLADFYLLEGQPRKALKEWQEAYAYDGADEGLKHKIEKAGSELKNK